ncbi:MAG TPA: ABC transporter ATP-binding protein [Kofleriaceae bacterium]|nr:ABC transporter ATP-binding protein [Kofleriaceae bacterium]
MKAFVELYNLGKRYDGQPVVRGFDLRMAEGEIVALLGHSGCGKSTVLAMVAGLTAIDEGGVVVGHREIDGAGPDRAVVFQAPSLLPWLSAGDNVLLGVRQVHRRASAAARADIVRRHLALVGLADHAGRRPAELSLGMQQRVGIARALALSPRMLLLDEPFGMLDALTRMELQDVLLGILEPQRRTALLVTHDVDEALLLADRIALMTRGPAARVGELLSVPFARPRDRAAVLDHADYYRLRARVLDFLDAQLS